MQIYSTHYTYSSILQPSETMRKRKIIRILNLATCYLIKFLREKEQTRKQYGRHVREDKTIEHRNKQKGGKGTSDPVVHVNYL